MGDHDVFRVLRPILLTFVMLGAGVAAFMLLAAFVVLSGDF